jgi:hypothetical protein
VNYMKHINGLWVNTEYLKLKQVVRIVTTVSQMGRNVTSILIINILYFLSKRKLQKAGESCIMWSFIIYAFHEILDLLG